MNAFLGLPWFDNESPRSLSRRFRRERAEFFARVSGLRAGMSVLDIGGTPLSSFFSGRDDLAVTFLNLYDPGRAEVAGNLLPGHRYVQGDARETGLAPLSFDIVFSNSLLEHLDHAGQEAAAGEIRRVGRFHFVQVPALFFPWEPHYNLPWVQFAPRRLQEFAWRRWPLSYGRRYGQPYEAIRLATSGRMHELFPRSTVSGERVGPLTKSWYAYGPGDGA